VNGSFDYVPMKLMLNCNILLKFDEKIVVQNFVINLRLFYNSAVLYSASVHLVNMLSLT